MKEKIILIINICKEKLHYYEFVRPIESIVKKENVKLFVKHYKKVSRKDIERADKIIICGTGLQDRQLEENIDKFLFIKNFNKPILGICAGMQIIGLVFGGKFKKKTEIGFYKENFKKNFLGIIGDEEFYHMHNYYIDFRELDCFDVFTGKDIGEAVKHKKKQIYGVLFHPEVRQEKMIMNFVRK